MAPNEHLKELPTIDTKCLEILKTFGYKGGNYSIKVSFGTFTISLENGDRIPEPLPLRRRKKPSAIKRDKNRRIEFLKNKNSTSSCPFSSGVNTLEETRVLDHQPPVTLPTDENPQINAEQQESSCVCQVVPCVCLASQPVSQPPPKLKLTKSDGIWKSSDTTNLSSSHLPLCPCCDVPLQDHQHQCVAAGDQTTEEQHESASDQCLDENLLNLKTCRDVVKNESLSSSEKHDILLRNLHEHLRQKPIDCVIAKYCFIHSLRFVHMMNNEPLPDNYMKVFLHEWNEIKKKM